MEKRESSSYFALDTTRELNSVKTAFYMY
jgi:hypothetical protein